MRFIFDLLYLFAALVFGPVAIYRMVRHGRYRHGWAQRRGLIQRQAPSKRCIWLHAVSVGEVNAAKTLLAEIEKRYTDCEIVVTTTTDTGYARAQSIFGSRYTVSYFPFDLSWMMARAFRRIDPSLCLLMELEVWPNFLRNARRRGVPVVVVNGRISDRSFKRYCWGRPVVRHFFAKIDLALAQTTEYAERFRRLGCEGKRAVVTNSLKYDTAPSAGSIEGAEALAQQLNLGEAPLWVAGGTGNDEERIILDVYQSLLQDPANHNLRLAVVPRKPERFDEVAGLIERMGLPLVRYSQIKNATVSAAGDSAAVILGDTMGDLRKFYSLATIIFVGRSLVPMGGSDMMEAAALGRCTVFGPHTFNFKQTVDALLAGDGAIVVKDAADLLDVMRKCLAQRDYANGVAQRGQQIIRDNQGATAKTMEQIANILPPLAAT